MKPLKIAGLCLVSMCVMGMVAASTASAAEPVWEACAENATGTKYEEDQCLKALGTGKWGWEEVKNMDKVVMTFFTLTLRDKKGTGGILSEIRCTGGGEGKGSVGPGGADRIEKAVLKNAAANCTRLSGGCKATEVEKVEGIHLPWNTKLTRVQGKVLDVIENSGKGEPGWMVRCKTLIGPVTDECESENANDLENTIMENVASKRGTAVESLVLATFENRIGKCTQGGAKEGELEGQFAVLLESGLGLRVG